MMQLDKSSSNQMNWCQRHVTKQTIKCIIKRCLRAIL